MINSLTVEERIIRSKAQLMNTVPFYSYILLAMRMHKSSKEEGCPTMAVNDRGDLFYNEDFVKGLNEKELNFVLAHEASHVSTLTMQRCGSRNKELWNVATDLVINTLLIEDGLTPPRDVLKPDNQGYYTFNDKNGNKVSVQIKDRFAEEIYEDLLKHVKIIKVYLAFDGSGSYKGGFDKHLDGQTGPDGETKESGEKSDNGGAAAGMSDKDNEEYWRSKAVQAHIAHTSQRGLGSGGLGREINRLLEPKVNWKQVLAQFLTSTIPVDFTMRRPGRKSHGTGVYMPSVVRESLDMVVGVDVSGSIGPDEYHEFMSEVYGIVSGFPQTKMKIVPWDDGVIEKDIYDVPRGLPDIIFEYKPQYTGGGTTLSKFSQWYDENMQGNGNSVCIIFTDGYIEDSPVLPARVPTLVVISKRGTAQQFSEGTRICKLSNYE
jgi:predicted metal-dependent peptidase